VRTNGRRSRAWKIKTVYKTITEQKSIMIKSKSEIKNKKIDEVNSKAACAEEFHTLYAVMHNRSPRNRIAQEINLPAI
jgi:hypothetical protein